MILQVVGVGSRCTYQRTGVTPRPQTHVDSIQKTGAQVVAESVDHAPRYALGGR